MTSERNKQIANPIILIFFLQIGLLVFLAGLVIAGRLFEGINVGAFFFAIIIGALGASISILKRIKDEDLKFKEEYEDLKYWSILMPILYGVLLTGVCYLMFMSGIISGDGGNGLLTTNLFPNFSKTDVYSDNLIEQFVAVRPSSMQDTGKLLVWSFLTGYSEKFVINVLQQLEKK